MNTRRTSTLTAAVLAGLLALSACGGGDDPTVAPGGGSDSAASAEIPESAPYNAQDVSFVQGMKPHHEQAVEMADIVLSKEPSPEVTALAEQIKAAQGPEIDQLDSMLATFEVEETSGEHGGGHGGGHGGSSDAGAVHEGMMSEDEMAELEAATGPEAERMFLEMMIEHHDGAISAADEQIADGEYDEAITLAEEIKSAQEREIAEMEQLLGQA